MSSPEDYNKELVDTIRSRGRNIIYPQHFQAWDELIEKQIESLHLFQIALDMMEALEEGKSFEEVEHMHLVTGTMLGYIRYIITYFAKQGPDYIEATASEGLSDEERVLIQAVREENAQFEEELKSIQNEEELKSIQRSTLK